MKRSSASRSGIRKDIFENFNFRGYLPPNLTSTLGQTGTSLSSLRAATGHVTECTAVRYCILHVVVQGPGSFRGPVNFFVRHTVAELPGVKVAQFSDFGLFSPYKLKPLIPSGDQPAAQGLHPRMSSIFPCGSRRSKGVPSGRCVFLRLLAGELGTPKLAQIFAYGI